MSAAAMALTVEDFNRLLSAEERGRLTEWSASVIGDRWTEVFEVRIREGWCEFDYYVPDKRDGRDRVYLVHWGTCEECESSGIVWCRRRVRCELPPVWPLGRAS